VNDPSPSSTLEEAIDSPPLSGVTFGQGTHVGQLRENNEDHYGISPDIGFFVVTDGVGGAPAGATAARLATAAMLQCVRTGSCEPVQVDHPEGDHPIESHGPRLIAAALTAHQMIRGFAVQNGVIGAATTMAALWVTRDRVHFANTGDSRLYRLTDDGLEQLSRDHTALQEHIELLGPPSPSWRGRLDSVVTQVLGGKSNRVPAVHIGARPVEGHDVFLLCTDGLYRMVNEADIAFVLRSAPTAQQAADILIELANDFGGLDNVTCIVVHVDRRG